MRPRGCSLQGAALAPGTGGGVAGERVWQMRWRDGEEKVEGWMRESIAEIVWRIGEAPFLVHLFSIDGDGVTVRPAGARVAVELARLRRALNTSMTWLLLVSAVTI